MNRTVLVVVVVGIVVAALIWIFNDNMVRTNLEVTEPEVSDTITPEAPDTTVTVTEQDEVAPALDNTEPLTETPPTETAESPDTITEDPEADTNTLQQ